MIRVMMLDDESPALRQAVRVLRTFSDVKVCGAFTDPDELLHHVQIGLVDLVLLDMELPNMHGLVLAEKIHSLRADIAIVFVTAYNEYAVAAFEVDALDYIMKPISEERLEKTLQRYRQRKQPMIVGSARDEESVSTLSIRCFGRFAITIGQGEAAFINSKSKELLAYLIHYNGEPVSKSQIMDALWPDREFARTQANLYSTVYQLRKDLEVHGLRSSIEQSKGGGGSYRFQFSMDGCDVYEFEQMYRACKRGPFNITLAERAIELYRSGYLTEHDYGWAVQRREELELRYADLLEMVVLDHVQYQRYPSAMPLLQKLVDLYPFDEGIHAKMIALYMLQHRLEEARTYLTRINEDFVRELGIVLKLEFEQIAVNPYAVFV